MCDLYLGPPRKTDVPSTFEPNEWPVPLEETIIEFVITTKTTLIKPDGSSIESTKVKTVLVPHNKNPHQNKNLSGEAQRDIVHQPLSEFLSRPRHCEKDDIKLNGKPGFLNQKQSDKYVEKKTTDEAPQIEKANERQ